MFFGFGMRFVPTHKRAFRPHNFGANVREAHIFPPIFFGYSKKNSNVRRLSTKPIPHLTSEEARLKFDEMVKKYSGQVTDAIRTGHKTVGEKEA